MGVFVILDVGLGIFGWTASTCNGTPKSKIQHLKSKICVSRRMAELLTHLTRLHETPRYYGDASSSSSGPTTGPALPMPSQVLADGTILGTAFSSPERDYNLGMEGGGSLDLHQPLGVNHQTGVVDTFPSIEVRVPTVGGVRVPLTGRVVVAVDPDGSVWFSHPTEYTMFHRPHRCRCKQSPLRCAQAHTPPRADR